MCWDGQPTMTVPAGLTAAGIRVRLPMTGSCGGSGCIPELAEIDVGRRTNHRTQLPRRRPAGRCLPIRGHRAQHLGAVVLGSSEVSVGWPAQPLPPTDLTVAAVDCGGL